MRRAIPRYWSAGTCTSRFPSYGLRGGRGLAIEENVTLSLYCLYFGGKRGPCHTENIDITGRGEPEPTYAAPLEILGPRDI